MTNKVPDSEKAELIQAVASAIDNSGPLLIVLPSVGQNAAFVWVSLDDDRATQTMLAIGGIIGTLAKTHHNKKIIDDSLDAIVSGIRSIFDEVATIQAIPCDNKVH